MHTSCGFGYKCEISYAQSAIIISESGDSIAAVMHIDMTASHRWLCVKFNVPTQNTRTPKNLG